MIYHEIVMAKPLKSSLYDYDNESVHLRTKSSGLYRHREDLGLHKVGYKGRTYLVAKLAFHAKESPIRTRVQSSVFMSSQPISPAHG